ncbi:efflux transporter outer membrane subunit [Mailhella sp.]
MKRGILLLLTATFAAGCSFAPDYSQPRQELPATWCEPSQKKEPSALDCAAPEVEYASLSRQWWKRFQDKTLDKLVEKALSRNRDITQGVARVDRARAVLLAARGELFPSVAAQGNGVRSRPSLDTSETNGLARAIGGLENRLNRLEGEPVSSSSAPSRTGAVWSGAVQAAWELDIWGKWRNTASAARESLLSAEEAQKALALSVAGQVCSAYFELLNCDAQLGFTEKTLASRKASAELYERQYEMGAISELDILNVRTQVDSLKDSVAQLQARREQAESALFLLTGAEPRDIYEGVAERGKALASLPAVPQLPAGLPSELLTRRPDIVSAEAALRAAHFQVGVARAAFFPSISLTGSIGVESTQLNSLFSGTSEAWSFGGSASLPLLTFGRTLGAVRQSEASLRELAASYEKTVQGAFRDIRNALALQKGMAEGAQSLERAAMRMEKAAELARKRYAAGYSPYLDVLEAERTEYTARMQFLERRSAQLSAIAQVCVALGGGW